MHRPVILSVIVFGLGLCPSSARADDGWGDKVAYSASDAMSFLNGTAPYSTPVLEAKLSAYKAGGLETFTIQYRPGQAGDPSPEWAFKVSYSAADVVSFLNGTGGYPAPVTHALICSLWSGSSNKFYVFYRRTGETVHGTWSVREQSTPDAVLEFLNGTRGDSPKGRAQIAAVHDGRAQRFYVFHKQPLPGQARGLWTLTPLATRGAVLSRLNAPTTPRPIIDGKLVVPVGAGGSYVYAVFEPQGLLVVTRDMFVPTLLDYSLDSYRWVDWKLDMGFETYVLSADWIDVQDYLSDRDILYKVRGWVQLYRTDRNVRFAMLVGDATNEPFPYAPPNCLAPDGSYAGSCSWPRDPPALSQDWNLPAGYHRWHNYEGRPQYTTFYLADEVYRPDNLYIEGLYNYDGSYVVNVGVVPVRTTGGLSNVLAKSMLSRPVTAYFDYYASDSFTKDLSDVITARIAAIGAAASPPVTVDLRVFDDSDSEEDIVAAYVATPATVIHGTAHGYVSGFDANGFGAVVALINIPSYTSVVPAYIASHCIVQAYMLGNSFNEELLEAPLGPAVVLSRPSHRAPVGAPTYPLAAETAGFYKDLFNGSTVGEAFYGAAHGAWQNPDTLFGDPSLVLFGDAD